MSNFKLTDEAKSILIKAVSFADEDVYHHPKDRIIEAVQSGSNTLPYSIYIFNILSDYRSFLKRGLEECFDEDERLTIRNELCTTNTLLTLYRKDY